METRHLTKEFVENLPKVTSVEETDFHFVVEMETTNGIDPRRDCVNRLMGGTGLPRWMFTAQNNGMWRKQGVWTNSVTVEMTKPNPEAWDNT